MDSKAEYKVKAKDMLAQNRKRATARANSNIAFIKYWGNQDAVLRLPLNGSISMNLDGIFTEATVEWRNDLSQHTLLLNGQAPQPAALMRLATYLDELRNRYEIADYASVISYNNFPMGAGIASSASAFAALATAATVAAGLDLPEQELSTLARLGSGSASRSVPSGFVEWHTGNTHETSYAETIAPPEHWELVDVIAIVSTEHKKTGSTEGHHLAASSSLQPARIQGVQARLNRCREAILQRDFAAFSDVVELDSNIMHAVMMTSQPRLMYWQPASVALMQQVVKWREEGLNVCYTLDAGPNVHCLCTAGDAAQLIALVSAVEGVQSVLTASVGVGAHQIRNITISDA